MHELDMKYELCNFSDPAFKKNNLSFVLKMVLNNTEINSKICTKYLNCF